MRLLYKAFLGYVQQFIGFLLFTSLFAALCAVLLCMATEKLVTGQSPICFNVLHCFIFGCTLLVYNVHYLIKKSTIELSDQYAWVQQNRYWNYAFLAIGLMMSLIFVFQLPQSLWSIILLLAVLSFAYSLPFLPFKNKHRLKDFGWLKIFVLSTVWTVVTTILPILYHQQFMMFYPFEIILRFVFVFILCLAFDIRDRAVDLEAGIFTIPNKIGLLNTYVLITLMCLVYIVIAIVQYFRFGIVDRLVIHVLTAIVTFTAVHYVRKHPSDRNYMLFIDGQMLLNGFLLLLF